MRLVSKLKQELGISFSMSTIFEYQTVEKLALYITQNIKKNYNQLDVMLDEGEL